MSDKHSFYQVPKPMDHLTGVWEIALELDGGGILLGWETDLEGAYILSMLVCDFQMAAQMNGLIQKIAELQHQTPDVSPSPRLVRQWLNELGYQETNETPLKGDGE